MKRMKMVLSALLFVILMIIPFGQASAASKLEVDAKIGIENKVKYGTGVPLEITVTNNGDNFSGDIVLNSEVDYALGSAMVYPFDIAQGETKTVHLYLEGYFGDNTYNPTTNKRNDFIHFFEGGIEKGEKINFSGTKYFSPSTHDFNSTFIYTLTENSDRLSAFLRLKNANTDVEVFHLRQLKDYTLPTDERELEMANVIAVDEFALSDLSDEQQQALLNWVKRGGTLLLGASDQVESTAGVFTQYLPLTLEEERITISQEGLKKVSINGTFTQGIEVYKATEKEGSIRVMAEGDNLLASATTIGQGRLLQTTFSLGDKPLASMDGYGKLLDELLGISDKNKNNVNQYYSGKYSMQREWERVNELFPSFEVSITWMVILIVIYIIVVAPILYFVLKRLDKREKAWWIIPTIAVVISLVLFIIGGRDRILHPQVQQMALFKVNEDSSLSGFYTNALLTNRGGDFSFETGTNTSVLASNQNQLDINTGKLYEKSYIQQQEKGSKITLKKLNYWSVQSVVGETTIDQAGKMDIKLALKNGKLQGTIANTFPFDLKDVTLVSGSRTFVLGNIKANGTLEVSEDVNMKALPSVSAVGGGYYNYTPPQTKAELLPARIDYLRYNAQSLVQDAGLPAIIAWSEEAIVPITLDGNAEMSTVSTFVQTFKPIVEMTGNVDFSMNDYEINVYPIGDTGYIEIANPKTKEWYIEQGKYQYITGFGAGIDTSKIDWQELVVDHDSNNFQIEILNLTTNTYEPINEESKVLSENAKQYINNKGEVTLQLTRIEDMTGKSIKLPTIELKGVVQE